MEIQDALLKQKEEQQKLIQEQRLTQLEHKENVLFLQRIILLSFIISLLAIGGAYFKYIRSKHRSEKQLIQKKKELEIQQAKELIELKNKELAASALKLIEKDEFIGSLRDRLSKGNGKMDQYEIKKIVNSISHSSTKNWEEFEVRFISVNKGFYEQLKDKFPHLTQSDKKLCALLKLNFSSKDISKLLNISVESVHTTRYRLRKKLRLTRDVNLTEFIASI